MKCDCYHVEGSSSAVRVYWAVLRSRFMTMFIKKPVGSVMILLNPKTLKKARILGRCAGNVLRLPGKGKEFMILMILPLRVHRHYTF